MRVTAELTGQEPASRGQGSGREVGIDALRIVAALAVILIHIHYELVPGVALQPWLRAPARFAVPMFFALSGYFLPRDAAGLPRGAARRVGRIALLFALASLLYLPFALLQHRSLAPLGLLTGGTWLHLWFLPALAFGLVLLDLLARLPMAKWCCWALALALLTALVLADANSVLRGVADADARRLVVTLRFLQAMPMIWIGFILSRSLWPSWAGLAAFGGGCLALGLQLAWYRGHGIVDANPEFPLGALPMSVGLIAMARHASSRLSGHPALSRILARAGARLTLPVYLLHPMAIVILDRAWMAMHGRPEIMVWIETALLGPAMLAVLWLADGKAPWIIDALNGQRPRKGGALAQGA